MRAIWAKYLSRRSIPISERRLAPRPSFRPQLEELTSREMPGSLMSVADAVAYQPPPSTSYADYSITPAAIPTSSSADPTPTAFTLDVTMVSPSGDATTTYTVSIGNAAPSTTPYAATPYDDPALTGDPTFSSSTDPSANQFAQANYASGSGSGSGAGSGSSSGDGSGSGSGYSSDSGSGSGSGSSSDSGSGSGSGTPPSSGSGWSYFNATGGGGTTTSTGVDSNGNPTTITSTTSWTLTVSGSFSFSGGWSASASYSSTYDVTIASAAPGGLNQHDWGGSSYTVSGSGGLTSSTVTYISQSNAHETGSQTVTTTPGAFSTTLAMTWHANQSANENITGSTEQSGLDTTVSATDTSSGNADGGSTGNGTYARTFHGGLTGGTAHSDQSQTANYTSTTSMNGSTLAPTFSGTSSQNANGSANDSYTGSGVYTVSSTAGAAANGPASTGGGTITESGGDHTDFNLVSQTGLGVYYWRPTSGSETQNASSYSHSTFDGNGNYTNPFVNDGSGPGVAGGSGGGWTQSGGGNTNSITQTTANVDPNGNWIITGSSTSGGDSHQDSTYTGGGAFTVSAPYGTVTSGPTSTGGGTTTESGSDHSTDNYSNQYALVGGGWNAVSGYDTTSDHGDAHSTYNANGVYTNNYANGTDGGSWTQTGGKDNFYNTQTTSALGSAGNWTTTGSSSNNGDDNQTSTNNGGGAYTVGVAGDATTGGGTTTESASDNYSDLYSSNAALDGYGNWNTLSGNQTSSDVGDTHSNFTGNGVYTNNYVGGVDGGTWNQSGGSDTNYNTETTSNIVSPNTWATTGASDGGGDDSKNYSYTGAGAYIVSNGLTSAGAGTTTESGGDDYSDLYSTHSVLDVTGTWNTTSGSGASSDIGNTHSNYTGNGVYTNNYVGGVDGGTWTQSGGSDTNVDTETTSTVVSPNTWAATGTSDGGGDDSQNSTYTGGGAYTVGAAGTATTGAGTTTESGADNYSDLYSNHADLGPNGLWTTTSASGTSSDVGNTSSTYTGNGVYSDNYTGGTDGGTWTQGGGSDTNYNTHTASILGSGGYWTTTGASTVGGDDNSNDSYTGSGAYTIPSDGSNFTGGGTTTENGSDNYTDNYTSQYALDANGNWNAVSGSGSSNGGGSTGSTYTGGGGYVNPIPGGDTTGNWAESGGDNTYYTTQTSSILDSAGNWTATGSADVGGGGNWDSSYSGSGSYTNPSSDGAGGVVTESGTDAGNYAFDDPYSLSNGSWQSAGGSAAAHDAGADARADTGTGLLTGDHFISDAAFTLGAGGSWTLTQFANSFTPFSLPLGSAAANAISAANTAPPAPSAGGAASDAATLAAANVVFSAAATGAGGTQTTAATGASGMAATALSGVAASVGGVVSVALGAMGVLKTPLGLPAPGIGRALPGTGSTFGGLGGGTGAANPFVVNVNIGILEGELPIVYDLIARPPAPTTAAEMEGRLLGHVIVLVQGFIEAGAGGVVMEGGAMLVPVTGPIGGGVIVVGAIIEVHGVVVAAAASGYIIMDAVGAIVAMAATPPPTGGGGGGSAQNGGGMNTGQWGKGSFDSPQESLTDHFNKHGAEVGATDPQQYLRKAEGFAQNLKGATKSPVDGATPGVIRYKKLGKYIDIGPDGKIISFGSQ